MNDDSIPIFQGTMGHAEDGTQRKLLDPNFEPLEQLDLVEKPNSWPWLNLSMSAESALAEGKFSLDCDGRCVCDKFKRLFATSDELQAIEHFLKPNQNLSGDFFTTPGDDFPKSNEPAEADDPPQDDPESCSSGKWTIHNEADKELEALQDFWASTEEGCSSEFEAKMPDCQLPSTLPIAPLDEEVEMTLSDLSYEWLTPCCELSTQAGNEPSFEAATHEVIASNGTTEEVANLSITELDQSINKSQSTVLNASLKAEEAAMETVGSEKKRKREIWETLNGTTLSSSSVDHFITSNESHLCNRFHQFLPETDQKSHNRMLYTLLSFVAAYLRLPVHENQEGFEGDVSFFNRKYLQARVLASWCGVAVKSGSADLRVQDGFLPLVKALEQKNCHDSNRLSINTYILPSRQMLCVPVRPTIETLSKTEMEEYLGVCPLEFKFRLMILKYLLPIFRQGPSRSKINDRHVCLGRNPGVLIFHLYGDGNATTEKITFVPNQNNSLYSEKHSPAGYILAVRLAYLMMNWHKTQVQDSVQPLAIDP